MEIKNDKELYESPAVNVLELKPEGLICVSGDVDPYSNITVSDPFTWLDEQTL